MDTATKIVLFFFAGCIFVLIVTHSGGFSQSAGSVFTGVNNLGSTLTGSNVKSG